MPKQMGTLIKIVWLPSANAYRVYFTNGEGQLDVIGNWEFLSLYSKEE